MNSWARKIKLQVRTGTWPSGRTVPAKLRRAPKTPSIHMQHMLHTIGRLTTPRLAAGANLNEYWACLRYFSAFTSRPNLQLTQPFAELDAHQKAILSDDLGMGIPMLWLDQALGFTQIEDGRYFIERILPSLKGTYAGKGKNGPGKSPDFACLDGAGRVHIVECKGTQNTLKFRESQLYHNPKGKPATGGQVQKKTVTLPANRAGERLACGLFIASGADQDTDLAIADPEDEVIMRMENDESYLIDDAMARGAASRFLQSVAMPRAAETVAFPLGRTKHAGRGRYVFEQEVVDPYQQAAARAEREQALARAGKDGMITREFEFQLLSPVSFDSTEYRSIIVRQSLSLAFVAADLERYLSPEPISSTTDGVIGVTVFSGEGPDTTMKVGSVYSSRIILRRNSGAA